VTLLSKLISVEEFPGYSSRYLELKAVTVQRSLLCVGGCIYILKGPKCE